MALLPYMIAFFAVSAYAMLGPIAKKVSVNLPPFTFITISSVILAITAGSLAYFFEQLKFAEAFQDIRWEWLVVFSFLNLVAYVGYLWAITKVPVAQYEMFGTLMPIIGGLFAVYLLKEPFHARYIASMAFIGIGIYIAARPDLSVKQ